MLQLEKRVTVHGKTVTLFTRTEVSTLQIKTPACNKILKGIHTLCVRQREM